MNPADSQPVDKSVTKRRWYLELPNAGDFDDEDLYNLDTDRYDRRKLKVKCPTCQRIGAPLLSPRTSVESSGWEWVGVSHQEPYVEYRAKCRCGGEYRFKTYTPQ